MPRRDQLTYDVEVRTRAGIPWLSVVVLLVVGSLTVLLLGWVVTSRTGRPAAAPPAPVVAASTPEPSSATPTLSMPTTGSDLGAGVDVPEGSQQAASRFVLAWLDRNPTTRKASLTQVAAPALAEQLMLTAATNIPVARVKGTPTLVNSSTYSAQFTQALTTGMLIRVYLVADPQARYRWLATSVEQA